MAKNNESTSKDPAELAFSAVEDALRDSVFSLDTAEQEAKQKPTSSAPAPKRPSPERENVAGKIAARAKGPANDDRYTSSKLLQSMQSRPSFAPLWIAVLVSAIWIVATGAIGWLRFGDQLSRPAQWNVFVTTADFAGLLAITTLPILGFFAVAILARRAQDLRIAATSMTQAAIRLAEPETTAADKVASVGQAVRREVNALGDGLERALSRAGELEVMVHNEVTSLERTYSDNEMRLRSLIQELAAQRESVITNSDRVREAIVEAHNMMVDDIDKAGLRLSETIVERGSEVKTSVDLVTENLSNSFGNKSEEFISLVDERSNNLLEAIDVSAGRLNEAYDDRASLVEKTFDQRSEQLTTALEDRLNALTSELDSRSISVTQTIDEKTNALADALQHGGSVMISDLESRGYAMNGALEAIGSRIITDIDDRTTKAETNLGGIADRLDENMQIHLNSLDSRLHTAVLEIGGSMDETTEKAGSIITNAGVGTLQQLDTRIDEVALVIDSRLKEVDSIVGDKGEKLIEVLNNHTEHFSTTSNLLETALVEKTDKLEDVINTQSARLEMSISERTSNFEETIEGRTKHLAETLTASTSSLSDSFGMHTDKFAQAIAEGTVTLESTLTNQTKEFAEKLGTRSQQLSDAMGTRTNEFGEILADRTQKLSDVLESRTTEFDGALSSRTEALSDTIGAETERMTQALDASSSAVNEEIRAQTNKIASTVESQSSVVQERVDEAMRNVSETMEGRANHVSAIISSKISEVNESIGHEVDDAVKRLSDAESGVTARIDSAAGNIADSAQHAAQLIEGGMDAARLSISEMVDERLGTLPEAITARADITADRLSALNENISTSLGKTMSDLETSADHIEETISSRIASASMSIANDVTESTERMDVAVRAALEQVRDATRHIEDLVEVKALDTANTLGAKVEEMNQTISSYSNSFSNLIDDKSEKLETALRSHGNILRSALEESSGTAEELMSASSSRILTDVNEALKKLNDGNLLLQRVLETSSTNLANLENSVADHTRSYASTIKDAVGATEHAGELVSQHVGALQTTIQSMVGEFGTLLGSLDTEAANINNAADTLNNAGNLTIDTLENRRDAMEALVLSFTARADDVDDRMRSFAQSIAETVNDTERRLATARRAMEDALDGTAQTVTERLDSITQSASSQSQQAGDQVRRVQQSLVDEIQSAFDEATSRFDQTANAMRATAHQVGSELEATRSELQRGVVELPEETRASAAAMRRVVAEQIEALNELNNIVRSQPGTHDVSNRRRPQSASPAAPRDVAPRAREPQPRPQPARQPSRNDDGGVAALLRPQSQPQRAPEAPQRGNQAADRDDENGSWLRDVLRNASASQQADTSTSQRGVNLSNLTDEVTRAMDNNALLDAWQRYRTGETNVFSRRIYTLTGQGTYDEVRKKIQRDPDFARTAKAYMEEFEQFLSNTAADPQSNTSMQEQLVSDRGKVYTMLAHASGRLS